MEGFEVFKIYTALKAHFLSKYDYVKSNGQTKVSVGAWNKRNDKYYFEKFGRLYKNDVEPMLISIFVQNPNIWVGDLVDTNHKFVYQEWKSRLEQLGKNMSIDIKNIIIYAQLNDKKLLDLFKNKGNMPLIYSFYLQNKICAETVILFEHFFNVSKGLDSIPDPLWENGFRHLMRYKILLKDVQWRDYKNILKQLKIIK